MSRKDFDYNIRFGLAMPGRRFTRFDDAKAYVLSGLDVARQHMAATRGSDSWSLRSIELSDEMLQNIEDCRSILTDKRLATARKLSGAAKRGLVLRCRAACTGFASVYRRTSLIQKELDAATARLRVRRPLSFCVIFIIAVALPTLAGVLSSAKGWRLLAGCLPFLFQTAWRAAEDRRRREVAELEKQYEVSALVGKTAIVLTEAFIKHIIAHIDPNPTAAVALLPAPPLHYPRFSSY